MQIKLRDWQPGECIVDYQLGDDIRRKLETELIERLKDFFPEAIVMKVDLKVSAACIHKPGDCGYSFKRYKLDVPIAKEKTPAQVLIEISKSLLPEEEVKPAITDPEVAQWGVPPEEKKDK